MTCGYAVSWGPVFYEQTIDGTPISLVDAIRDSEGVGGARLWRIHADGSLSLMLDNIGSRHSLSEGIRRMRRQRMADKALRNTPPEARALGLCLVA